MLAGADHQAFLHLAPVDYEALIVRTARRWSGVADRRWGVDSLVEGVLTCDEIRVESALDALIENAIAVTGPDDRITIIGRCQADEALLEVADEGPGIAPEHLPLIFDRFFRPTTARAERRRGTGLGLAIVRAIAEAYGGSASVTSTVGVGTTFTLRLPRFAGGDAVYPTDHGSLVASGRLIPAPSHSLGEG